MKQHLAKWMLVTDALRSYVTTRGVNTISAHGRSEIIHAISKEITDTKSMIDHMPILERSEVHAEIVGAANFLHALRQADEALPSIP